MKRQHPIALILALTWSASLGPELYAQITSHPEDPTATMIDTLECSMELPGDVEGEGEWMTTVWLMPDSSFDLVIDLESFLFPNTGPGIDTTALSKIIDSAAARGLRHLVMTGRADTATTEDTVEVWTQGWGERSGFGTTTRFRSCSNSAWSRRKYRVGFYAGEWWIFPYSITIDSCNNTGSCEPTAAFGPKFQ